MSRAFSLLAATLLLAGCHRYAPARIGTVPEGTEVRMRLSQEALDRLDPALVLRGDAIIGRLVEWSDEVVLSVPVPPQAGMVDRDLRQRVTVPVDDVLGVDVQELSRTRTALLSAAVVAAATTAVVAAVTGVFGGEKMPVPPGQEEGFRAPRWWPVLRLSAP